MRRTPEDPPFAACARAFGSYRTRRLLLSALLVSLVSAGATAEDWPEWRGAGRRGVWTEDGILERFPDGGLTYKWRRPIAEGYSGPAVAAGRVFVTDFMRDKGLRGIERALCLDEATGELLWMLEWPIDYSRTDPVRASGPRATPTIDGERVHFFGGMGHLVTADTRTGEIVWQRDLVADFDAVVSTWGVTSAPLVFGSSLITLVGGEPGAGVVAFDKTNGEERWRALSFRGEPGYAPPVIVEAGGVQQLIIWHPEGIAGLDPTSGAVYWQQPLDIGMGMTVATPVVDRGRLLVTSFFDGAMLLELDNAAPRARVLWHRKGRSEQPADSESLHGLITTPFFDGDYIYGVGSYGELRGLRAADGERVWESLDLIGEQARWAAALIVRHDDRYFANTDRGDLVIARFTPEGYQEIDRTHLLEPTSKGGGRRQLGAVLWSHPAYANRHIVVRNDREIVRADLGQPRDLSGDLPRLR